MAINTVSSSKSSSATNTKPVVEPVKPVDPQPQADTQPTEPAKVEPPVAPAAANELGKTAEKSIISLSIPEKLGRQVRLLAKLEGKSISAIFLDAVSADIPARLKTALAAMIDE